MRKSRKHLQGRRGEAFLKLIRGVPRDQIISVSIDVHKYYHLALIHNDYGEILVPSSLSERQLPSKLDLGSIPNGSNASEE